MGLEVPLQQLLHDAIVFIPKLVGAIIVFLVALFVAGCSGRAARRALERRTDRAELASMFEHIVHWGVIVAGALSALSMVNFDVTSFVAGLGITGVVVGLALQDIARNFVAGVILLLRRPYCTGEAVSIAGIDGAVVDMNTRDTTIRRWDGEQAIVPNSTIFTSVITNYSRATLRQRTVRLEVNRLQPLERTIATIREAVTAVEGVAAEPGPSVRAEGLGDNGMILALRFWVDTTVRGLLDVHSDAVLAANAAIVREGIDVPYPTRTVRLQGAPSGGEG